MSGDTKVTWNSLHRCKAFLICLWWHVLRALHSPGSRSGLFLLILKQPLPIRAKKGALFGWKSRFWTKNPANTGETKKTKTRRKGVFSGRKYKKQTPSIHFLNSTFKHHLSKPFSNRLWSFKWFLIEKRALSPARERVVVSPGRKRVLVSPGRERLVVAQTLLSEI